MKLEPGLKFGSSSQNAGLCLGQTDLDQIRSDQDGGVSRRGRGWMWTLDPLLGGSLGPGFYLDVSLHQNGHLLLDADQLTGQAEQLLPHLMDLPAARRRLSL